MGEQAVTSYDKLTDAELEHYRARLAENEAGRPIRFNELHMLATNLLGHIDAAEPRKVETYDELVALPDHTYIRDREGYHGYLFNGEVTFNAFEYASPWEDVAFPVTVLYVPETGGRS